MDLGKVAHFKRELKEGGGQAKTCVRSMASGQVVTHKKSLGIGEKEKKSSPKNDRSTR